MLVKVSNSFPTEPILRQTPGSRGLWKGDEFHINDQELQTCDVWVVLDDVCEEETAFVRSGRAVLITMDPPLTKDYRPAFLAQFDLVVSCHRNLRHPNVRNEYQGQPWHIGMHKGANATDRQSFRAALGYDDFLAMPPPPKPAALSIVCSVADRLPGHRARLEFVRKLEMRLGDRIDVFGRGIKPIADKYDAIAPYRYHVVLENSALPDYWTEKLADALLGWAFPFYWGCSNIFDYFPRNSLIEIDVEKSDESIELIESIAFEGLSGERMAGLAEARSLMLDRYNTFEVVRRLCGAQPPSTPRELTLRPQLNFRPSKARRLLSRASRKISDLIR